MAQLTLKILGKTNEPNTGLDAVIQRVTKDLKSIENTKVKITVDSKDIDAAVSKLEKAAKAVGGAGNNGAAKQMQELGTSAQRTAEQIEKLTLGTEKLTKVYKYSADGSKTLTKTIQDENTSIGNTIRTIRQFDEAGEQLVATTEQITANIKTQQKYTQDADKAYQQFTAEIESNTNHALRDQIDALTGVSSSFKDAKESASVFMEHGLTDLEKELNTAAVKAGDLGDGLGEVIKHQEVWNDGQLIQSVTQYRDELGNVTQVVSKLNGTEAEVTKTLVTNSEQLRKQADAAELAAKRNTLLGDSLERIVAKVTAWQVLNWAISSLIGTFREAVQTIKEVDSELVTIRKTTDLSEQEIKQLTDRTYELASAYGRTADELLKLTSTFARAGMHDQLEEMTELAALLENVGDLEGDTAAKFILAANAAWKLNGSYDALMEIIDGMNAVTNQAAVDMEALTTGITVSGSVFANAGESAQTYTALVGTAVAATQRSGSEVARGLRTIAMNVRSIKGELDDGEIIDAKSISDAAKALDSVGISVSDARGELRLTSDVLGDLAGKWDSLTTAEQAYLAESLAGKRQANVLTALMQNWEEVQRQMELYANGAGSALEENKKYLDSWEAKTQQLKAAWTEFISEFIETDTVKDLIDTLIALVDILSVIAPLLTLITGPLKVTVEFISKFIDRIKELAIFKEFDNAITKLEKFAGAEKDVADSSKEASDTVGKIVDALVDVATVLFPLLWGEWLNPLLGISDAEEEVSDKTDDLVESQTDLFDILPDVTSATEEEKSALEKLRDTLDNTASSLSVVKTAFDDFKKNGDLSYSTLSSIIDKFSELNDDSLAGYITRLTDANLTSDELQRIMGEMTLELVKQKIETENLTEKDQALVEKMLEEAGVANASEVATSLLSDRTKQLKENTSDATTEIDNFNNTPVDTTTQQNAVSGLSGKFDDLTTSIHRARWELDAFKVESGDESRWQINKSFDDYAGSKNYQKKNFQNVVSGTPLQRSRPYINPIFDFGEEDGGGGDGGGGSSTTEHPAVTAAKAELQARKDTVALLKSELTLMQERGDATTDIVAKMREIQAAEHDQADYMRSVTDLWDELGIDQGDINALSTDWWKIYKQIVELTEEKVDLDENELDNISAKIALEKQNLSFLESSGASTEQQIAQIKVIQAQLHIEAEIRRQNLETLKETAATEAEISAAEKEIVALSTEWWSYQQKIVKLEEEQAKQAEEARKNAIEDAKKQALELLEAEEKAAKGPLQEQLDILEEQRDALKNQNDEQEKLLAVEKARIALQNAQNERKNRVYNASTGDWEWMADASTVSGAQDALNKAEQALADYYANQQIEALKTQINAIAEAYKTLRSAIEEFASAILDGTMGYRAAVASLMGAVSGTGLESTAARAAGLFSGIGNGAGSSRGGSATGASRGAAPGYGLDTSIDYSLLMANAQTLDEFNHWANLRTQKIAAMGYDINALGWDSNEDIWKRWAAQHGYDRGGILRGIGGIKATYSDEMVLPPEATAGLLNAERSGAFDALLAHLGIVTSAANNYAGFNGAVASRTSIGSQYNGPMYQFGDICMTEDQARSTTVYDLAQMARALSLHNNH